MDESKEAIMAKEAEAVDPKTGEVKEPGTQVANSTAAGPLANIDVSAYSEDAGAGYENQTSEDVGIPFWVMMQPGSPEVLAEDSEIKAGMWLNRTTGEVVSGKEGLTFVPVTTQHEMVEWKPRDSGGGLVARHAIDSEIAQKVRSTQKLGSYKHPDQYRPGMSEEDLKKVNDLVETFTVYGLVIDADGVPSPGIINFASTHIKSYRDWNYKMRMVTIPLPGGGRLTGNKMPMWAVCWSLKSDRNEKNGNTWYTPNVGYAGANLGESLVAPGSEVYQTAKSLRTAVQSGAAKADESSLRRDSAHADAPERQGSKDDADAPY